MPTEGSRTQLNKDDPRYPQQLLDLEHAPDTLYVLGNPDALMRDSVSIIGARKASPYGIACARLAAQEAASMGLQVVSGAAIGCDQASQTEALDRGSTCVAVMGCGADVIYPSGSARLLQRIVDRGGAIVSIVPWGTAPARWTFVRRNPIIAALSRALVICEAGMPSGTFSTAHAAIDIGREVLVFPGSFFSLSSRGCNYLIAESQGCMPLWDAASLDVSLSRIFGRLVSPRPEPESVKLDGDSSNRVFFALQASSETVGNLSQGLGMSHQEVMRALGDLASRGLVKRLVDGKYSLTSKTFLDVHATAGRSQRAASGVRQQRASPKAQETRWGIP
jgi:DNA processing protein